jgi:hypothetical protein
MTFKNFFSLSTKAIAISLQKITNDYLMLIQLASNKTTKKE